MNKQCHEQEADDEVNYTGVDLNDARIQSELNAVRMEVKHLEELVKTIRRHDAIDQ